METKGSGGELPANCYQTQSSATLLRSVHAPGIPDITQIALMCTVGGKRHSHVEVVLYVAASVSWTLECMNR